MRYIMAIIILLSSFAAWAGELRPGTIYTDNRGCEWYIIETAKESSGTRLHRKIKEFVIENKWGEYEYCGSASINSHAAELLEEDGCFVIKPTDVRISLDWSGPYYKRVNEHFEHYWAAPTGNCGAKP
jgi:hypothetical protein